MGFFKEKKDGSDSQEFETPKNQILETPKEENGSEKLENKKANYGNPKEGKETEKKPTEETGDDLEKKEKDNGTEKLENKKANIENPEDKEKGANPNEVSKEKLFRDRLKAETGNNTEKNKGNNNETSGDPSIDQRQRFEPDERLPEKKNSQKENRQEAEENER